MSSARLILNEIAPSKGIANPFVLSKESGLNYAVCYRLWHEQTSLISLPTLGQLCDTLRCQPGDLLVLTASQPEVKRKSKGK